MEDFWVNIIIGFFVVVCLILVGLLCFTVYTDVKNKNNPVFELYKHEWTCTETTTRVTITNMLIGKVIVPQTQVTTICLNYKRK